MTVRRRILAASRAAGVEPQLRTLQNALRSPGERRNLRDDANLAVVMASVLRSDSNCIDIGANVGSITNEIVRLAPRGRHIAVEPLPELAEDIRRRHPGVEVACCALSDAPGNRTFVREVDSPARSGFRRQGGDDSKTTEFAVEVRRLDDLVPSDVEIAFVKIDVEGAEEEVLRGGLEMIHRCRPVIALEHGDSAVRNYGTSHGVIHELLTDAGLAIFDMDANGPFSRDEFEQIADPPGDRWNFFARPL